MWRLTLAIVMLLLGHAQSLRAQQLTGPLKGHVDCQYADDDGGYGYNSDPGFSCSFELHTEGGHDEARAQQNTSVDRRIVEAVWRWFVRLVEDPVALFTFVLGVSTVLLWRETRRLAVGAEGTLETSERAYVSLDGFECEITTLTMARTEKRPELPDAYRDRPDLWLTRFAALPRWKNSGGTPTRNMRVRVNWGGPNRDTVPPSYGYEHDEYPFFIAAHATELSWPIEIGSARSLIDYGITYQGAEPRIFIWGRADYEDVFGNPHFTEWCRELRFDCHDGKTLRATFIQWGDYNRTDDGDRKRKPR